MRFADVRNTERGEALQEVELWNSQSGTSQPRIHYDFLDQSLPPPTQRACANKFFGLAFSWALGQSIKDTLCGTKVLFKEDYERIAANRAHFGDFDPFGDFDLIFGANHLHLRIGDIPIRYRDRTYGETNIQRWRHGLLLMRMLLLATAKIKLI